MKMAAASRVSRCSPMFRMTKHGVLWGVRVTQLRKALANFGINLGQRIKLRSQTFSDLKQDGLLSARITTIKANDSWSHWLAWDAASQAVIDPRNDGIPSRRTRITSYFPISRQGS